MHQVNRGLVVVALLGAVGIGVGIGASLPDQIARSYAAEDGVKHDGLTHVDEMAGAFKSVAKALHPTVVSISSLKRVDAARVPGRPELPPEFRRFFDDDLMRRFFENQQLPRGGIEQKGLGSGVVIRHDAQGYWIEDSSRNGTRVNDRMIDEPTLLQPGDRIYIERYVIVYRPDDAPAETLTQETTQFDT